MYLQPFQNDATTVTSIILFISGSQLLFMSGRHVLIHVFVHVSLATTMSKTLQTKTLQTKTFQTKILQTKTLQIAD